jgi:hypothetical protein
MLKPMLHENRSMRPERKLDYIEYVFGIQIKSLLLFNRRLL